MKAIEFSYFGSYDALQMVEKQAPSPLDGQLLVQMTTAAVNPVDNTIRSGLIPQANKLPMILGNEGAGVVVTGNDAFPAGTRVMLSCFNPAGQVRGIAVAGAWQQFVAVYPSEIIRIPDHISDDEAAAFPVSFFSAQACLNKADFLPGKSVLSLGAGGAVGNAGVQLAKALDASLVITTAGSSEKTAQARAAGMDNVIDLTQEKISEGVARITGGKGVDIVLDSIGGNLTGDAIHALARNGILVTIGYAAGTTFTANITDFVWKGLQMRGQSLNGWFDVAAQQKVWDQLMPLFIAGKIKPVIAKVYSAEEVAAAQQYLSEQRPFGKVLIRF